ncbi:MAG TPA: pyridoxal-phosphate dependent enzyme [Nitrospirae bacterium]|nr:pyridoxal-phosphate dependent enzyme [Nitrospirota bacterium]
MLNSFFYSEPVNSVLELVGNTPMVRINKLVKDGSAEIYAKIEFFNPCSSIKGRICRSMIESAENRDTKKYYMPDQYGNPSNRKAHYLTTGPEIIEQTKGKITHFIAGLGTTGTIMGTGKALKEFDSNIKVIAVEPDDAMHGIEGLKHMESSLVPAI